MEFSESIYLLLSLKVQTILFNMETATIILEGDIQTVRLPKGVRLPTTTVYVRQEGESVVLEPVKLNFWPEGFFESIHIADPLFKRPDQGQLPPVKKL